MVFASASFLFLFFPITLGLYYIINRKYRNAWLFIASFVFYAWSGVAYAILILTSTIVNYFMGLTIDRAMEKKRKLYVTIGVVYNLSVLGFFKYFNFFVDNIEKVIKIALPAFEFGEPIIPLPIGISFFTFQIMSYIIDLYRCEIKVQKSFVNLGLYIMLFPQLIAGPIVRYIDVEEQISNRKETLESFSIGIKRFVLGLAKKVCIANAMGAWADAAFDNLSLLNTPMAWLGIVAYMMQIFFDFSAYSDMAIGLGKMFGFDFLENFNYPYIARSMQDFWRRWHMSLTTWFRDYLYIPLGGNRHGKFKTYRNNLVVFFCTGMWHGASWNFILWGLYHGVFLILEKIGLSKFLKKIPKVLSHCYVLLFVIIGWVFFRANDLTQSVYYLKNLFVLNMDHMEFFLMSLENWKIFMLLCAIVFSTPIVPKLKCIFIKQCNSCVQEIVATIVYFCLFVISIMFVAGSNFNPFIYFRF